MLFGFILASDNMSLVCNECGEDLGPSKTLPGREGTMVYPSVISLIYLPEKEGAYTARYLESQCNRSLCFRCISDKLPQERHNGLNLIYEIYEAETELRKIEKGESGLWIGVGKTGWSDAYKRFEEKLKKIDDSECLFCNKDVKNGKPFFTAMVIERAYSQQHLSGLFAFTNYSWTNFKVGSTQFRFCFEDFRKNFPRNFEQLSYDMQGIIKPKKDDVIKSELVLEESVAQEIMNDPKMKKQMDELAEKSGVDVRVAFLNQRKYFNPS